MPDLPIIRSRDMAAHLGAVGKVHQEIAKNIRDSAMEHEVYHHERNLELNVNAKLGYKGP